MENQSTNSPSQLQNNHLQRNIAALSKLLFRKTSKSNSPSESGHNTHKTSHGNTESISRYIEIIDVPRGKK